MPPSGCLAWLAGAAALAVLATLPGRLGTAANALATWLTPQLLRRAAGALTGAAVLVGPSVPAFAASDAPLRSGPTVAISVRVGSTAYVSALPLPDRPAASSPAPVASKPNPPAPHSARAAATRTPLRTRTTSQPAEVVVLRGDTLWGISARHLGPRATSAQIAADWPRWWHANRDRIGPDPSLLLPGQVLRTPLTP